MSDLPPPGAPDGVLPEEDGPDMAAAELALGILDGAERAAAVRRVLAEPGFAREVERWRGHLAQMFDLWPAMPAPDVLPRVEQSIDRPAPVATLVTPARSGKLWPGVQHYPASPPPPC